MTSAMTMLSGNDELVPLGDGPVATVFAGVDAHSGTAFALKVFPGGIDRRTRGELDAELRGLADVRTQAHVLVADRVEELPDGRCALRMELCAQSLPELVASFGPLTIDDTLALGSGLASALAAAHEAGTVHGGVTPGNVLFRPSGEPVLADFGLALRHAFAGDITGAVDFLAPETVRDGTRDERTDLYGLGAVLYFALSGASPHQGRPGEQADDKLLRTLSGDVAPLQRPDLPAGLGQLVAALLAKNPDARPLDAATVAARVGAMTGPARAEPAFDDFGGVAAGSAPTHPIPVPAAVPRAQAMPPGPPRGHLLVEYGPEDRPRGKSRTGLVLAATGALAVLAVAVVVLLLNRPAQLDVRGAPEAGEERAPSEPSVPPVHIELAHPVDKGNYVELSWSSSESLDYAIVVAAEGQRRRTIFVQRVTEYRIEVDPVKGYCFQVQGANSAGVYTSQSKPIHNATCTE
ncbi:serine/threonine protein kinase [Qaidamihabitans albus]|uniref:serine/threonine protein kinase n=1 Tax=Qaidamihabitans albus TaxID=2795733 RepID=UPI001F463E26|nr:protein kinase [Qaidamihabitans albus]